MESTIIKKKICLLGEFGVGKTSLICRFVSNTFDDQYLSTIGVKVSKKIITFHKKDDYDIELQLYIWDIEGFKKKSTITEQYYSGASGAIIVGDITREETLTSITEIREHFLNTNPDAKLLIAGNKIDLFQKRPTNRVALIKDISQTFNLDFFLTSAKTGDNVEKCFKLLSKMLIEN